MNILFSLGSDNCDIFSDVADSKISTKGHST